LGRVDLDRVGRDAVDEGLDAQVEVGLRAGDRSAQVGVGVPCLDDGGIVAVDLDGGVLMALCDG
jgi:hypothetical protein